MWIIVVTLLILKHLSVKIKIKFKLITGVEEKLIDKDLEQTKKYGYNSEISTRLRYTIIEVDGDNKPETITAFSQNMLARDSMALRNYINEISPDIDLTSEIEIGGETVSVSIPLTVEFFGLSPSNKLDIHQSIFYFIYGTHWFYI